MANQFERFWFNFDRFGDRSIDPSCIRSFNFKFLFSALERSLKFILHIIKLSKTKKKKRKCIHDSTTRKPVERKSIFSVCRVSIDDIINYHVKLLFLFNDLSLNTVMKTGFSTFLMWKTSYGSLLTLTRELSMQEVRTNRENEKLWNYN